jgi:hypothetical protein
MYIDHVLQYILIKFTLSMVLPPPLSPHVVLFFFEIGVPILPRLAWNS